MSLFKVAIPKIADTLINQASLFNCSLETAWEKYMHPILTERVTYKEVKIYIDEKVALGEKYEMDEKKRMEIIEKAIDEASKIFGVDPAYFGEEGEREVDRQLEKMGYNPQDFRK